MENGGLRMNSEKSEVVVSGRGDGPVIGNIQDARGKQVVQKPWKCDMH